MEKEKKVFNENNFLKVPFVLFKVLSHSEAVYFSFLCRKETFHEAQLDKNDGWFYIRRKHIETDVNIKKSTQIAIESRLCEMGIILKRKEPKRTYYKIDYTNVNKLIEGYKNKTLKGTENVPPIYNKSIHNNETTDITIDSNIQEISDEIQNDKSLYYLSHKHYEKYIRLFHEWNTYSNLSKMKLPKNKDASCTKSLKEICVKLDQLMEGTFYDKQKISNEHYDKNKIYTLIDIKKSFKLLNLAHEPGWYSHNKRAIPQSLKRYLVTYGNQFSYFVKFMENPPKQIKEYPEQTYKPNDTIISLYINATGLSTVNDRISIEKMVKRLQSEYEQIEKNVGLLYRKWKTEWANYYQTFNLFCKSHIQYLKDTYGDQLTIGHLASGKNKQNEFYPVWNRYIQWIRTEHKINMYPLEKSVLKRNRYRYLIESKLYNNEDFEDFYLKEEWELINSGRYLK